MAKEETLKYADGAHLTGAILISVPIIVIRINLPVADWENETFVCLMVMLLHIPDVRDTLWHLFMVFPSSCGHSRDFLCVSLYAACFYPGKVVSLIVGTTMVAVHVAPTFFSIIHWQFSFLPSGTLDKIDRQCHKIHTLRRDVVAVSDSSRGARGCALAHSRSFCVACGRILMFVFTHICKEYHTAF